MGKTNPSAEHGKQNDSQVNKSKTTRMPIDFEEIDALLKNDEVPAEGITAAMLAERYGCANSTALLKLKSLAGKGYEIRKAKYAGRIVQYAIKEAK